LYGKPGQIWPGFPYKPIKPHSINEEELSSSIS